MSFAQPSCIRFGRKVGRHGPPETDRLDDPHWRRFGNLAARSPRCRRPLAATDLTAPQWTRHGASCSRRSPAARFGYLFWRSYDMRCDPGDHRPVDPVLSAAKKAALSSSPRQIQQPLSYAGPLGRIQKSMRRLRLRDLIRQRRADPVGGSKPPCLAQRMAIAHASG